MKSGPAVAKAEAKTVNDHDAVLWAGRSLHRAINIHEVAISSPSATDRCTGRCGYCPGWVPVASSDADRHAAKICDPSWKAWNSRLFPAGPVRYWTLVHCSPGNTRETPVRLDHELGDRGVGPFGECMEILHRERRPGAQTLKQHRPRALIRPIRKPALWRRFRVPHRTRPKLRRRHGVLR